MSDFRTTNALSRRRFLGVGLGAAAMLAGCGGGKTPGQAGGNAPQGEFTGEYDGPQVTLSYWNGFTGGDGPFMKQMVKDFMSENPKIKVADNTIEWGQFYQRMPAAVQAGKGPDVGVMHMDQLATNAARQVIVPLDDVAEALKLTEEDFTPEVWNAGIYQDKRYGIPLDVHSLAMYWNKDQFQEANVQDAPTDGQSYMETLDKLKSAGFENPFWMPSRWPAHLMFLSLLWQNGGQPYAEDGSKSEFASDAGVDALTWMVDIIKKGYSPEDVAQDSQYVAFKNKQVQITWDGIWQINDLKAANMPFDIAPIPQIGEQNAVWANSHNFFMTRQASQDENKSQAARVFIDYLSKKSGEWAGAGMIPARVSVREGAQVQQSTQAPVAEQIAAMKFLPPIPGLGDVTIQSIEVAVAEATLLKKSPAEALQSVAGKADQLMEENRKKFGA